MITYKKGDLLKSKCNIICHQVNCQGVMGSGIAKQIRELYPKVYEEYKKFVQETGSSGCYGMVQLSPIGQNYYIANIFTQYNFLPRTINHTNYALFRLACQNLKKHLRLNELTYYKIGFPDHIGCGLAGGDWDIVKEIIEEEFKGPEWNVEIWKMN